MAAASLSVGTVGRGIQFGNLSGILVNVVATATVYATATGGLPIDLTGILQSAAPASGIAPNYTQALHPSDVIGLIPIGIGTGFIAASLTVGTPTYTAVPGMTSTNASGVPGILATCPATIRMWGTGNANAAHLAEIADGAVTETFSFIMLVARNGANS